MYQSGMSVFALPRPAARVPDHVRAPLHDGGTALLRPMARCDAGALDVVFAGLSARSRANRYFTGMDRLPPAMRTPLLDVDDHRHVAWVALVDEAPVGIARYVTVSPHTAEVAFEVVDAHQRRGIATVMLDALTTVAAARGVRRVQAALLASNAPARRLVDLLGLPLRRDGELLEGETPLRLLDPARVDRGAVLAMAGRWPASAPSAC